MSVRRPRLPQQLPDPAENKVAEKKVVDLEKQHCAPKQIVSKQTVSKQTAPKQIVPKQIVPKRSVPQKNSFVAKNVKKVSPRTFNGRGVVVVFAVLVSFLLLFTPVREYVSQKKIVAQARLELEQENFRVAYLENEIDKWNDVDYVKQYVRKNLFYIMPGEVAYVTSGVSVEDLDNLQKNLFENSGDAAANVDIWYENLWNSISLPVE